MHEVQDHSPDQRSLRSITTRTRDAYNTQDQRARELLYTDTLDTREIHRICTHTHTHLISSCVHHSKPRELRSMPLSCAYCTRQRFSDGLGVTAWAKEQSCWIWPTRGCVILTIQSIGTVCFVALRLLELFSKNAQGFFFFAKLWEIIWSLFFVF